MISVYVTTAPLGEAAQGEIHNRCTRCRSMMLAASLTDMSTDPIRGGDRAVKGVTPSAQLIDCRNSATVCLASKAMAVTPKPRRSEADSVVTMFPVIGDECRINMVVIYT